MAPRCSSLLVFLVIFVFSINRLDARSMSESLGQKTQESECRNGYFKCGLNNCISYGWVCDGFKDCPNGEDEADCGDKVCNENSFKCGNGQCIPEIWACDGQQDCSDGLDEANCEIPEGRSIPNDVEPIDATDLTTVEEEVQLVSSPSSSQLQFCGQEDFICEDGTKCVVANLRCDGKADCIDESDEKNCTNDKSALMVPDEDNFCSSATMFGPVWKCKNGGCILLDWVCDGSNDCGDYSDERDCDGRSEVNREEMNVVPANEPMLPEDVVDITADMLPSRLIQDRLIPIPVTEESDVVYEDSDLEVPVLREIVSNEAPRFARSKNVKTSIPWGPPTGASLFDPHLDSIGIPNGPVPFNGPQGGDSLTNLEPEAFLVDPSTMQSRRSPSIDNSPSTENNPLEASENIPPNERNPFAIDAQFGTPDAPSGQPQQAPNSLPQGFSLEDLLSIIPAFTPGSGGSPLPNLNGPLPANILGTPNVSGNPPVEGAIPFDLNAQFPLGASEGQFPPGVPGSQLPDALQGGQIPPGVPDGQFPPDIPGQLPPGGQFPPDAGIHVLPGGPQIINANIDSLCLWGNKSIVCRDGKCIPEEWRCDGEPDCQDGSDEFYCDTDALVPAEDLSKAKEKCLEEGMWSCATTPNCIPIRWLCDGDNDCGDNSDEEVCGAIRIDDVILPPVECGRNQERCRDGRQCIFSSWKCDGSVDCNDGSDEDRCSFPPIPDHEDPFCTGGTLTGTWRCHNNRCIMQEDLCNGVDDCGDNSDESLCRDVPFDPLPNVKPAHPICVWKDQSFRCASGDCVPVLWRCDGEDDCDDGSDELECGNFTTNSTKTTEVDDSCSVSDNAFKCENGQCVSLLNYCDEVDDCGDGSDELNCNKTIVARQLRPADLVVDDVVCSWGENAFKCSNGKCIPRNWTCDGSDDCGDDSDEKNCNSIDEQRSLNIPTKTHLESPVEGKQQQPPPLQNGVIRLDGRSNSVCLWGVKSYRCRSGACVPLEWTCDGHDDCGDDSDELPEVCTGEGPANVHEAPPDETVTEALFVLDQDNCPVDQFQCDGGKTCIFQSWVCDESYDCDDKSDEVDCHNYRIPSEVESSAAVNAICKKEGLPGHTWRCENKKCIRPQMLCDGYDNCGDNSDEDYCPQREGICGWGKESFTCRNKKCIPKVWECDGENDCEDNSDEMNCDVSKDASIDLKIS